MSKRLENYLRAIENGTTEKYHDYMDVYKRRMTREDYEKKWGFYTGCRARIKDVR